MKDAAGHAKHIGAGGARGVVWALVFICAGCGDLDSTEPFIESTCTTDKDCPSGHACIETWVEVPDPPAPTWPDGAMDATKTADTDDEGDSPGDAAADASDIVNESRLDHADEADVSRETDALVDVAGDENGDRDVSDESRADGDIATDVSLDVPDRAELGAEDAIDAFDAVSDGTATGDTAAPDALDSDGEGGDEGTQTPARRASMLMTTSDASDDMDASLDGGRSDDRDGNDTIPAPDVSVDQPKPPTHLERRRSCSTTCSNSRCQSGWECSSPEGLCVPFACGEAHPCEMAGTYCDPVLRVCRSAAGECANDNDCLLDDRVKLLAKASCRSVCRVAPILPALSNPPFPGDATVGVSAPIAYSRILHAEDLTIAWDGAVTPAIVLLLEDDQIGRDTLLERAVWGYAVRQGEITSVPFAKGVAIEGGAWTNRKAEKLDEQKTYYVLVQGVNAGKLTAFSQLVPFQIGPPWPKTGSACTDEGVLQGQCFHPERVQGCSERICKAVCMSHADCPLGSSCLVPTVGRIRYCG